jgi:hypothetical protein
MVQDWQVADEKTKNIPKAKEEFWNRWVRDVFPSLL